MLRMSRYRGESPADQITCNHLAAGILVRGGKLLMVASRYANHPRPLWNLPGGRQLPGELLAETVTREVFEETSVRVEAGEIAYVSESYDGDVHFLNVTFRVILRQAQDDNARDARRAQDDNAGGDHVVEVAWVPLAEVPARIAVGVVREPLVAYLKGLLPRRYAGFHDAGVTIEWPQDSR
jgi:ADP-ribose pyrophosphatase YjhB (NUDIX family)